ncbi:ABC transporter substrate-binding protein [Teichococcus aestuarii]|uniref:ABC transporter substrate-binding protein n=1 Tax=Teichococcus aestuarii TaxID=568898 RepID=UPI003611EEC8
MGSAREAVRGRPVACHLLDTARPEPSHPPGAAARTPPRGHRHASPHPGSAERRRPLPALPARRRRARRRSGGAAHRLAAGAERHHHRPCPRHAGTGCRGAGRARGMGRPLRRRRPGAGGAERRQHRHHRRQLPRLRHRALGRHPDADLRLPEDRAGGGGHPGAAGSPVRTLADLRGRSVAVNRGGTGEYLLVRALERAGIDPAGVRRAYLSPSDSGAAFVQGHVDAWASWDPFITIAQRSHGARVLADGAAIGSDNAVTLMAHSDMAAHRRPLLQAVFAACRADNDWAQANPAEAGRIWTEAMGLPEALAPAIGANNAVPMRAPTEADVAQIERIADWYVANRIVRRRPDIAPAVVRLEG